MVLAAYGGLRVAEIARLIRKTAPRHENATSGARVTLPSRCSFRSATIRAAKVNPLTKSLIGNGPKAATGNLMVGPATHSRRRAALGPFRRWRTLVVAAALALWSAVASGPAPAEARGPAHNIQHVVVIDQENHSFDETLGAYCQARTGRCDGYTGPVRLRTGATVPMTQSADVISPDITHTVRAQLTAVDRGAMDGWGDIPGCYANGVNLCLTYYLPNQIPSMTALADRYVVSDRTFSMANSPSWGGHLYPAAATLDGFTGDIPQVAAGVPAGPGWGCDSNRITAWKDPSTGKTSAQPSCVPAPPGALDPTQYPYGGAFRATTVPTVPTIFDRLDAVGLPWRLYSSIYVSSICPSFAECLYGPQHANVVPPANILTDAKNGTLPAYSILLPTGPGPGTGQHPPSSMLVGDNWIGKVLNALQTSPQWSSTAVFITYDDCGCFYDHVPPGTNPDGTAQGIRVPVIASPYARPGYTDSTPATFASILRFTEEAFGLAALGPNDLAAYDYANSFTFGTARPTARVQLRQHPIPERSREFIATHSDVGAAEADPT